MEEAAARRASILSRVTKTSDEIQEQVKRAQEEKIKQQQLLIVRRNFKEPEFVPERPPDWFRALQKRKEEQCASGSGDAAVLNSEWSKQMMRGKEIREKVGSLIRNAAPESRPVAPINSSKIDETSQVGKSSGGDPYSSPWIRMLRQSAGAV